MRINLIGQRNSSGIGNHFGAFATALASLDHVGACVHELDFQNPDAVVTAAQISTDADVTISFVGMNIQDLFAGLKIQWVVFESTRIPLDVLRSAELADRVWVPSNWGRRVLVANGIADHKIDVIPEGVDSSLFHSHGRSRKTGPFVFLAVGKYEIRKSYTEIFTAFAAEFGRNPDVELLIKSDYFRDGNIKAQQMIADLQSHGFENWRLNWGHVDHVAIADMYRTADVFVSAPRGEAWGLPIIEAAASGLPVISTMYSGHLDFLQAVKSSVIEVDWTLSAVDCPEYMSYYPFADGDWGRWAVPNIASLQHAMRCAYEHHRDLSAQACKNSMIIRRKFSWSASADLAVTALESSGVKFD